MSTRADALWKSVDEKVEAIRHAQEATARGDEALRILSLPAIEGHIKERFRACIDQLLVCPDAELIRWRANAAALIDHYTALTAAVAQGTVAAQRLAEVNTDTAKKE